MVRARWIGNATEQNLQMFVIKVYVHAAQDTSKLTESATCTKVKYFKLMVIRIFISEQENEGMCISLSFGLHLYLNGM